MFLATKSSLWTGEDKLGSVAQWLAVVRLVRADAEISHKLREAEKKQGQGRFAAEKIGHQTFLLFSIFSCGVHAS